MKRVDKEMLTDLFKAAVGTVVLCGLVVMGVKSCEKVVSSSEERTIAPKKTEGGPTQSFP